MHGTTRTDRHVRRDRRRGRTDPRAGPTARRRSSAHWSTNGPTLTPTPRGSATCSATSTSSTLGAPCGPGSRRPVAEVLGAGPHAGRGRRAPMTRSAWGQPLGCPGPAPPRRLSTWQSYWRWGPYRGSPARRRAARPPDPPWLPDLLTRRTLSLPSAPTPGARTGASRSSLRVALWMAAAADPGGAVRGLVEELARGATPAVHRPGPAAAAFRPGAPPTTSSGRALAPLVLEHADPPALVADRGRRSSTGWRAGTEVPDAGRRGHPAGRRGGAVRPRPARPRRRDRRRSRAGAAAQRQRRACMRLTWRCSRPRWRRTDQEVAARLDLRAAGRLTAPDPCAKHAQVRRLAEGLGRRRTAARRDGARGEAGCKCSPRPRRGDSSTTQLGWLDRALAEAVVTRTGRGPARRRRPPSPTIAAPTSPRSQPSPSSRSVLARCRCDNRRPSWSWRRTALAPAPRQRRRRRPRDSGPQHRRRRIGRERLLPPCRSVRPAAGRRAAGRRRGPGRAGGGLGAALVEQRARDSVLLESALAGAGPVPQRGTAPPSTERARAGAAAGSPLARRRTRRPRRHGRRVRPARALRLTPPRMVLLETAGRRDRAGGAADPRPGPSAPPPARTRAP